MQNALNQNIKDTLLAGHYAWALAEYHELSQREIGSTQFITPNPAQKAYLSNLREYETCEGMMYGATAAITHVLTPFSLADRLLLSGYDTRVVPNVEQKTIGFEFKNGDDVITTKSIYGFPDTNGNIEVPDTYKLPTVPTIMKMAQTLAAFSSFMNGTLIPFTPDKRIKIVCGVEGIMSSEPVQRSCVLMISAIFKDHTTVPEYGIDYKAHVAHGMKAASLYYLIMLKMFVAPDKDPFKLVMKHLNALFLKSKTFDISGGKLLFKSRVFKIPSMYNGTKMEQEGIMRFSSVERMHEITGLARGWRGSDDKMKGTNNRYQNIGIYVTDEINEIATNAADFKRLFMGFKELVIDTASHSEALIWIKAAAAAKYQGRLFVLKNDNLKNTLIERNPIDWKYQQVYCLNDSACDVIMLPQLAHFDEMHKKPREKTEGVKSKLGFMTPQKETIHFIISSIKADLTTNYQTKVNGCKSDIRDRLKYAPPGSITRGPLVKDTKLDIIGSSKISNGVVYYTLPRMIEKKAKLEAVALTTYGDMVMPYNDDQSRLIDNYCAMSYVANIFRTTHFMYGHGLGPLLKKFGFPTLTFDLIGMGNVKRARIANLDVDLGEFGEVFDDDENDMETVTERMREDVEQVDEEESSGEDDDEGTSVDPVEEEVLVRRHSIVTSPSASKDFVAPVVTSPKAVVEQPVVQVPVTPKKKAVVKKPVVVTRVVKKDKGKQAEEEVSDLQDDFLDSTGFVMPVSAPAKQ